MKKKELKKLIKDPVYFLGISDRKNEAEREFDDLFQYMKRYYITHSKYIKNKRNDLGEKCILCDIFSSDAKFSGSIYVSYASVWNKTYTNPVSRYLEFTDYLISKGFDGVIYSDVDEDLKRWKNEENERDPGVLFLEKMFYEKDYYIMEIHYKGRKYILVKKYLFV